VRFPWPRSLSEISPELTYRRPANTPGQASASGRCTSSYQRFQSASTEGIDLGGDDQQTVGRSVIRQSSSVITRPRFGVLQRLKTSPIAQDHDSAAATTRGS